MCHLHENSANEFCDLELDCLPAVPVVLIIRFTVISSDYFTSSADSPQSRMQEFARLFK